MTVDSYLELYTTLYGWALAGVFRDILISTGLVFLPFLLILGQTWIESHKSSSYEGADAAWMVRVMEVELGIAIFVIAFCFMPTPLTKLSAIGIKHTPVKSAVNPTPVTATPANPDSSGYKTAFPNPPDDLAIPLWWYSVMSLSSGFNEAVRGGVSGATSNLAAVQELGQSLTIADPHLRNETGRFVEECFIPARSRFQRLEQSPQAQAAIATFNVDDTDWIGSHAYQDDPRLYPEIYARSEVPGFALDLTGADRDMANNDVKPAWSRPSCLTWWADGANGLKKRLIAGSESGLGLLSYLGSEWPGLLPSEKEDTLARAVARNSMPIIATGGVSHEERDWFGTLKDVPQLVMGGIGAAKKGFDAWVSAPMIQLFAQTVQPIVLLAMYMFMPLILVFGRFSLKVMFLGALAIFTVKSWASMWYIASWLYDHMTVGMYPNTLGMVQSLLGLNLDDAMKRAVLNTVLIGMYLGFPLIWTSMLGWIGYRVGGALDNVQRDAVGTGQAAGSLGAGMGGKLAGGAGKLALKGAGRGLK